MGTEALGAVATAGGRARWRTLTSDSGAGRQAPRAGARRRSQADNNAARKAPGATRVAVVDAVVPPEPRPR
jgi:predicted NBD/HSP70 family sugar kinase